MATRPTNKELTKRIEQLEKKVGKHKKTEDLLLESEKHYRLLAENVRDVIWTVDLGKDMNFTYLSPSIEGLLGYTVEETMKLAVEDIVTPQAYNQAVEMFAEELVLQERAHGDASERHVTIDLEHVRKDGSTIWAELNAAFLRNRNGRVTGLLGVTRDISERKFMQDALRDREERYRIHFEKSTDVLYSIDPEFKVLSVSPNVERILGYTPEELIGRSFADLDILESEYLEQAFSDTLSVLSGRRIDASIYEFISRDGKKKFGEISGVPLVRDGKVVAVVSVGRDITARKRAEEDLRQSEDKYRTIIENIEEGYFEIDLAGKFTFVNDSVCRMMGYTRDEMIGMDNREYTSLETAKSAYQIYNEMYRTGNPANLADYEIIRKDGRVRIYEMSISLMRDLSGNPSGFRGVARDVTDRKHLEEKLLQAQKMESIGTLAGGIAHDFNNLLMGVLGNISLMLMGRDEQDRDYERLRNIEQYVLRGSELTKRLLGFARGGKYEVRPTNLQEYITRSVDMFGQTKKEIRIHHKYSEDLWTVEVDQGQMEQVLLNLFVNAWQAMPGGGHLYLDGINVELGEEDVEPYGIETGRYVKITVSDTGIGMDEDIRAKIFDPFFTTKDRGRGAGLGLASVYGIVKNHDGFITVESEKGKGAIFISFSRPLTRQP